MFMHEPRIWKLKTENGVEESEWVCLPQMHCCVFVIMQILGSR
jgi:hypothetical protein